ncbi:hypothetical protein [Pandoraea communis]|uniref:hypothetical protein n=1 Tax=Pandoraea communis TaxID=2508297 RepID=UPI0025A56FC4|nr:hypothetical protein [Pandoraea communis]MDM8356652.1 hypothetical protein [Pandoraea communis]
MNTSDLKVAIETDGAGRGHVEINGSRIPNVQSVTAHVAAGELPKVTICLAVTDLVRVCYDDASLEIGGVVMPVEIEAALWRYLSRKYGREIDATTLQSIAREWVLLGGH